MVLHETEKSPNPSSNFLLGLCEQVATNTIKKNHLEVVHSIISKEKKDIPNLISPLSSAAFLKRSHLKCLPPPCILQGPPQGSCPRPSPHLLV